VVEINVKIEQMTKKGHQPEILGDEMEDSKFLVYD